MLLRSSERSKGFQFCPQGVLLILWGLRVRECLKVLPHHYVQCRLLTLPVLLSYSPIVSLQLIQWGWMLWFSKKASWTSHSQATPSKLNLGEIGVFNILPRHNHYHQHHHQHYHYHQYHFHPPTINNLKKSAKIVVSNICMFFITHMIKTKIIVHCCIVQQQQPVMRNTHRVSRTNQFKNPSIYSTPSKRSKNL